MRTLWREGPMLQTSVSFFRGWNIAWGLSRMFGWSCTWISCTACAFLTLNGLNALTWSVPKCPPRSIHVGCDCLVGSLTLQYNASWDVLRFDLGKHWKYLPSNNANFLFLRQWIYKLLEFALKDHTECTDGLLWASLGAHCTSTTAINANN